MKQSFDPRNKRKGEDFDRKILSFELQNRFFFVFFCKVEMFLLMTIMLCVYVSGERTSHFRGCLIESDMCQPISHFDVLLSMMMIIMFVMIS